MSACYLPDDVLHDIFTRLVAPSVIQCRAVCRRWCDAVESLSDSDWRKICCNSSGRVDEYNALRKKYGLSWRELQRATENWSYSYIESAEIGIEELADNVNYIKVLPHNCLACLQSKTFTHYYGYSDTIVYYSINDSKEISKLESRFPFSSRQYDENEHLIVLIRDNGELYVIVKENSEEFKVGTLNKHGGIFEMCVEEYFSEYTLIENQVFFKNDADNMIYVSKLVHNDKEATLYTTDIHVEEFDSFRDDGVVQFVSKDNKIYLLTTAGVIYKLEDKSFKRVTRVPDYGDQFMSLKQYGFDWRSRAVYFWVTLDTNNSLINFNPPLNAFYAHGDVLLGAKTFYGKVYIHWSPFLICNLEDLYDTLEQKPNRVIDFTLLLNVKNTSFRPIHQLDIIENGVNMKVVVLGLKRLFLLEFNPSRRYPMRLRNRIIHRPVLKTNIHKKQLKKKQAKEKMKKTTANVIKHTHPYATRSKVRR